MRMQIEGTGSGGGGGVQAVPRVYGEVGSRIMLGWVTTTRNALMLVNVRQEDGRKCKGLRYARHRTSQRTECAPLIVFVWLV